MIAGYVLVLIQVAPLSKKRTLYLEFFLKCQWRSKRIFTRNKNKIFLLHSIRIMRNKVINMSFIVNSKIVEFWDQMNHWWYLSLQTRRILVDNKIVLYNNILFLDYQIIQKCRNIFSFFSNPCFLFVVFGNSKTALA